MNAHIEQLPSVTKIAEESPKASKPHRCMICDGEIAVGEKHRRLIYKLNDSLDSRRNLRSIRFHIGPCKTECF